jgi:protein involved in sex pheromone biosynthesis
MKKLLFVPAMATVLFLASCGGGNESSENTTTDTTTTETATAPAEAPGADIPGIDSVQVTDHIE